MNESSACLCTSSANSSTRRGYLVVRDRRFRRTVLAIVVASVVFGISAPSADPHFPPEEYLPDSGEVSTRGGFDVRDGLVILEGDIIIGTEREFQDSAKVNFRGFAHDRALSRWPNGVIPYRFDTPVSAEQRSAALQAIQHYHDRTRISFVESQPGDAHATRLIFRATGGCASYVGRTDFAEQDLFIENCTVGSIIHELGHAIGLYHEHTRRDRDNFITVNWDQVAAGRERNFEILTANAQHVGGYDYGSIMHYGKFFFSRDNQPTIDAPDGVTIGQRDALSLRDIAAINLMYATDLALSVGTSATTLEDTGANPRNGVRLDIAVTNNGVLGAGDLQLVMQASNDADWLTISQGSGWSCSISGALLTCDLPALAAGSNSRFEITMDPGSGSADDLRASLSSRTMDTEATNNAYNGGVARTTAATIAAQNAADAQQDGNSDGDNTSSVAALEGSSNVSSTPNLGAASGISSGGGGSGVLLLALTAAIAGFRRR